MTKFALALFLLVGISFSVVVAEETNLPPDPFANLDVEETAPEYTEEVDRSRGSFSLDAKEGSYVPGDHFAHWHWKAKPGRWGKYYVGLNYTSNRTKLGVQVKVGDLPPVKSYAPRTGRETVGTMILGTVYIPKDVEYPVMLLTGDQSNVPDFMVKGLEFTPAPEGETLGQSIDGTVHLHAKSATTYAEKMRYEPKQEKNCLGFWVNENDWAEWEFEISSPGEFEVKIVQGCGTGNGGSDVNVLINDETLSFKVVETGGFQNWKEVPIGKVKLDLAGQHKLAIKPVNKAGKAVMDIQKLVLTPVSG